MQGFRLLKDMEKIVGLKFIMKDFKELFLFIMIILFGLQIWNHYRIERIEQYVELFIHSKK